MSNLCRSSTVIFFSNGQKLFWVCGLASGLFLAMPTLASPTAEQLKVLQDSWHRIIKGTSLPTGDGGKWSITHRQIPYMRTHIMAKYFPTVGEQEGRFLFYGYLNSKSTLVPPHIKGTQKAVYIHEESGEKFVLSTTKQSASKGGRYAVEPLVTYGPTDINGNFIEISWHFETTETNTGRIWRNNKVVNIPWSGNATLGIPPISTNSPIPAAQAYQGNTGPLSLVDYDYTLPGLLGSSFTAEDTLARIKSDLQRTELLWLRLHTIAGSELKADWKNTPTVAQRYKEIKAVLTAYSQDQIEAEYKRNNITLKKLFLEGATGC